MKRNRVFLWVFPAIQVIFLGWVTYAGVSLPQSGSQNGVAIQVGLKTAWWARHDSPVPS